MNQAGDIAEIAFMLAATKRGYSVFTPHSHNTKIDVIVHRKGHPLIGVQVKKGSLQKNKPHLTQTWKVLIGSAGSSHKGESRFTKYSSTDFDVLAMYVQELDTLVFYHLADIAGRATLRWNNKHPSDNWRLFDDYT